MKPIPTETSTDVGYVGKWVGAAAAGALLMYLFDPQRGAARRSRAVSAVRHAGARTGATVDHALHSASDRLGDLKDSAASAISRGASILQAQATPVIERAQHGVQYAKERFDGSAERARERVESSSERARERAMEIERADRERALQAERAAASRDASRKYNTYEADRSYDKASRSSAQGGLASWLHDLNDSLTGGRGPNSALLGGSVLGLLSLVRRKPAGLLIGLGALALLLKSSGKQTYKVEPVLPARKLSDDGDKAPYLPPGAPADSNRYLH